MRYGQATDVGKVRETNEDGIFSAVLTAQFHQTSVTYGVFMVVDGMGGAGLGDRVTALILPVISNHILQGLTSPDFELNSQERIAQVLVEAMRAGNHANIQDPELSRCGATLTAAIVTSNQVIVGHVGDTRAYWINLDNCQQLTHDHTTQERLADYYGPDFDAFDEWLSKQPPVLYRALGQVESIDIDTYIHSLSEGEHLLLCSDGLHRYTKDEEIQRVVLDAPTPQEACDRLIALANERGGEDNISVIVVQV